MEKIKAEDLGYESDYYGYQILYKGKRIGGAGTNRQGKKTQANARFQVEMAAIAIRDILDGRIPNHMRSNIEYIQKNTVKT